MAKRNQKNSKDEWRRRKKAKEKAEAQPQDGEALRTPEDVKRQLQKALKGLSEAERAEFHDRWGEQMNDIEAGVIQPPYHIHLGRMAQEARAAVRSKTEFRRYKPTKREKPEDQSVESYLEGMSYVLRASRQEQDPKRKAEAMRMYVAWREARVFHIGHETYIAVHQEADRYTTEMSGLDYHPYNPQREIPAPENDRYTRTLMKLSKHQGWPDKFPFPVIYLGYDKGAILPQSSSWLKAPSSIRDKLTQVRVLGHLLTAEGYALSWIEGTCQDETGTSIVQWIDEDRSSEYGWPRGLGLEPWILPHLVRIINDHRTFVVEAEISGEVRRGIKENKKALGLDDYRHMPKPYYTLRMHTHVVREKVKKQLGRPRKSRSYKTDVRGHERCRIRRGVLPIDPKLADKLQKRGYKIFSTNQLDQETFERLAQRGLAFKKADEWLAVKATWIDDFMSSTDPKLPYIPAVRKLGSVRVRPRKHTGAWTEDPAAQ